MDLGLQGKVALATRTPSPWSHDTPRLRQLRSVRSLL
jgi:hypothetical protein